MKKILSLVTIAALILGLIACGRNSELPESYITISTPKETTATKETTTQKETETVVIDDKTTKEINDSESEETDANDALPEEERKISEGVADIVDFYKDESGYMPPREDILLEAEQKVYKYAQELASKGEIEGCAYCDEGYSVSFFLNDGCTMVYAPEIEGYYSGGDDFTVAVYDFVPPEDKLFGFITELPYSNPGETIKKKVPEYSNVDFGYNTTIEQLVDYFGSLDDNHVRAIFWRGHGNIFHAENGENMTVLSIGEIRTNKTREKYKDISKDSYVLLTSGNLICRYCISPRFFDLYMSHVNGGMFFTGSCHGGNENGGMAEAFLNKGFDAYVGATRSINIPYSNAILSRTAEYLCEKNSDGRYLTISEALSKAEKDYEGTPTEIIGTIASEYGAFFKIYSSHGFRLIDTETDTSRSSEARTEQGPAPAKQETFSETMPFDNDNTQSQDKAHTDQNYEEFIKRLVQHLWNNHGNLYYFDNERVTEYICVGDRPKDPRDGTYIKHDLGKYTIELVDYIYKQTFDSGRHDYIEVPFSETDWINEPVGGKITCENRPGRFWFIAEGCSLGGYIYKGDYIYYDEFYSVEANKFDTIKLTEAFIPSDAVEFNGHYYRLYKEGTISDSSEALQFCQQQGGHLATITSADENAFVYNYILSQGCDSAYFGLTDSAQEGEWAWCNGENAGYQNWGRGEANDQDENEDWAMFYYKFTDGSWNDGIFKENSAFICEWGG